MSTAQRVFYSVHNSTDVSSKSPSPPLFSINREAAAGSLPKETAVPLALALNELLTNAAMHSAMIVAASLSKWS